MGEMRKRPIIDGPIQARLLDRAGGSKLAYVYASDYREMRAARALVARGRLSHIHGRLFVLRSSIEVYLP